MQIDRYLSRNILTDLANKMVFVGGARQVGKTTLAKELLAKKFDISFYYNWDYTPDRKKLSRTSCQENPHF